jgi:hypothetical protein
MEYNIKYLPCHEAHRFDDSGLNNLFTREDAPCNSIWPVRVRVGAQVATIVDHIIGDVAVALDVCEEEGEKRGADEKLQVRLKEKKRKEKFSYNDRPWNRSSAF